MMKHENKMGVVLIKRAVLLMLVLSALIVPDAISKYSATAAGAASARVAKWDPQAAVTAAPWNNTGSNWCAKTVLIRKDSTGAATVSLSNGTVTLNCDNTKSEVSARFRFWMQRVHTGDAIPSSMMDTRFPTIGSESAWSLAVAPGSTGSGALNITPSFRKAYDREGGPQQFYERIEIAYEAEQVD